MSSSNAHAHHGPAPGEPTLAHHFDTQDQQDGAVRLGMWLFLGTEVLLFAGLFLGYTVYRHFYHEAFHEASRHLDLWAGVHQLPLYEAALHLAETFRLPRNREEEPVGGTR